MGSGTLHGDDAIDEVAWRRLDRRLWAASRQGRPLGTVEHGHRYTALDVDGGTIGRYDGLDTAMAALAAHHGGPPLPAPRPVRVVVERTAFTVTSAFGLGAVAVIGYAIAAGLFG
ncbi:hypothetical protein QDR37_09555 [Amnibacterium sp. CER49]|uniref:hypothetical protein n=1 Tax=Amnibacterium sp. CER49 TaxID=3039161 RepID=UPI002448C728|nr:hypothetical protein [Amnibacterium sp. CER49]MDH2444188.1 hypothetical protein [Amnibacterium sp. CER49]